MHQLGA